MLPTLVFGRIPIVMDPFLLAKGLVIGFSIAAPVGPIGLLCIVRTLSRGRVSGLFTGLGAATADGVYGFMGGFGVTVLTQILVERHMWFRLIGGVFLIYLGLRSFFSTPKDVAALAGAKGLLADYGSTFALTLTNPMTMISFGAVFASLGLGTSVGTYADAISLLIGIVVGSALWWLVLSFGVSLFRGRTSPGQLGWINKVAGTIIAGFGIAALVSVVA